MRILFASTRGAGHFNPMVPFIDACLRSGHQVLVVGPPPLAETVERAGYAFAAGAVPPEEELATLWERIPSMPRDEAERAVIGGIFATLNVRAMLPGMRAAVREWRPDVIVRDPAEFASAVVADAEGVAHVQVGIGLAVTHMQVMASAAEAVDTWEVGLTERIAATPYLTLFPASLEDPEVTGPPVIHRFRDPATDAPRARLTDYWPGDDRPLVYVTFGSVTAGMPVAAPIYGIALEAVATLPARVLLTTGQAGNDGASAASGPHVHVAGWVPQAEVLPQARVVVCHGGAGTTLGSLAAGVPLVVTPLFADQPENGRRVAAVGAGVVVEPRDRGAVRSAVDPGELRDAITAILADATYARAAGDIAVEMRRLPPVDDSLDVLAALG